MFSGEKNSGGGSVPTSLQRPTECLRSLPDPLPVGQAPPCRWLERSRSYGFAQAMADLVCYQDLSLVKGCEGKACVLLLLDRTHARARRRCSMSIRGNRAKQAAHRKRSPGKPESKLLKRAKRAAPTNSRIQRSIHRTFLIKVGSKFRMFKYSFFPVRRRFFHKSLNGSHIQVMGQLARGLR